MFAILVSSDPSIAFAIARACSPRVARYGRTVVADVSGCARTIGSPAVIAREVMALATGHDLAAQVAVAETMAGAWILAQANSGMTVAAPGAVRGMVADLSVRWLETLDDLWADGSTSAELIRTFERWGVMRMGALAALPRRDVLARLGPAGARLHQAASGEDARPFVPEEEAVPFVERMGLEWPIEGLEPLAFVLARLSEQLAARLERADRGAVVLRTRLRLVTRDTHERVLCVPSPIGDARVLRTLVLLDLESHPPSAGIDSVELHLEVVPGRIVQGSLLAASLPRPEDLTTLIARLGALMGDARVGSPTVLDTWDARAVGLCPFDLKFQHMEVRTFRSALVGLKAGGSADPCPQPVIRRFRHPVVARVVVEGGVPVRVTSAVSGSAGTRVVMHAGPWRSSGGWWTLGRAAWDRDEWDVQLADGSLYRLVRDRTSGAWEIEGSLD